MADIITEVNKDGDEDDFGEDAFDTVIAETNAGDLRIDDDKEEKHKDDIGDVADITPNDTNRRGGVVGEGFYDEEIVDDAVNAVYGFADDAGGRTDEPADGIGLVGTSGAGVFVFGGGGGI